MWEERELVVPLAKFLHEVLKSLGRSFIERMNAPYCWVTGEELSELRTDHESTSRFPCLGDETAEHATRKNSIP
jgi:hypothetical protein